MSELYNPSSIFDFKSLRTVVKYGDLEILTNDADTIFFRCGGMGIAYHQKVNAWSSPLDWPEHSGVSFKQLFGKSQVEQTLPLLRETRCEHGDDVRCVHCYPPSVIPMAHENKTATEMMIRQANETLEFPPPMEGQDSWGIHDRNGNHVATIPCKGSIKSPITGEWEQRVSPLNWYCANHPPGSEVEVKKGEACYCGNKEAN